MPFEAHPAFEVPPEDEQALGPPGDPETVARTICLRLLDQRARTRAELADALRRKGVPDEPAAAVLDRFAEVGLIDDEALAGTFALAQHRERGLARRAVAVKLRRRGLDEQVVAAALDPIDRDSEYAAARTLVAKKLRSLSGLDPQAQARRLVGLLGRRGYPAGLAHEVVREALAGVLADTSTLDDAYDAAADLT
jgi:regulatory protein